VSWAMYYDRLICDPMAVAQWRQMRQMPHFWNGKYNLWKQIKSFFFFKICLNSPPLPHFIQTRPTAVDPLYQIKGSLGAWIKYKYFFPKWNPKVLFSSSNRRSCTQILYKCVDKTLMWSGCWIRNKTTR